MAIVEHPLQKEPGPPTPMVSSGILSRRSIGILVFAVVALAGMASVLIPMALNQDAIRLRLQAQIAQWTGMSLTVRGGSEIGIFPLRAVLRDVSSQAPLDAISMSAERIELRLSTFAAFTGHVEIKQLLIDGANISIRQSSGFTLAQVGKSGALKPAIALAQAAIDSDVKAPNLNQIGNRALGSVSFKNSSVSMLSPKGVEERFSALNAQFDWPSLLSDVAATGSVTWRGETVSFKAGVAEPLLLFSNGSSDLDVSFKSDPLTFDFDGKANLASDFFADGALSLKAGSIRRVLAWGGASMPAAGNLGAVSVVTNLTTSEGKLKLGDLQLTLDDKPATGTIEIDRMSAPISLSGTLAFESIDLASLMQSLPIEDVPVSPIANPGLLTSDINLDLRLSAETAVAWQWPVTNAAGTIRIDHSGVSLDLGSGNLAGGNVTASFRLNGAGARRVASLKMDGDELMLDSLFKTEMTIPLISAPVQMKFDLAGEFRNWRSFLQSAKGQLQAEAKAGTIRNFSADTFNAAVSKGQIFALPETYSGIASLESATMTATLEQGAAIIDACEIVFAGQRVVLAGAIPFVSNGVALNGLVTKQPADGDTIPFFVGGSWEKPFVTLVPLPG